MPKMIMIFDREKTIAECHENRTQSFQSEDCVP